jgi:hypothetical protein
MKSNLPFLFIAVLATTFLNFARGQNQEPVSDFEPLYVTVNTLDVVADANFDELIKLEQEYFDKVTFNNDLILLHETLIEKTDSSVVKVKFINMFGNWNDIKNSEIVNEILIAQNWPYAAEKKLYFEKQNDLYSNFHSDNIYLTTEFNKNLSENTDEETSKSVRIDTSILSDLNDDGAYQNYVSYVENVIYKNPLLSSYQPIRQYYGGDSREFVEIFVLNSGVTFEQFTQKNTELFEKFMEDAKEREKFIEEIQKSVESKTTSYFISIGSLSK